jgi:hypothetical protein
MRQGSALGLLKSCASTSRDGRYLQQPCTRPKMRQIMIVAKRQGGVA